MQDQRQDVEAYTLGSETVRDSVIPQGSWKFNDEVAAAFDDMLSRSIPQYSVMRTACASLAAEYARDGGLIVDLGTSRGEALAELIARRSKDCSYLGLEISEPMLKAATDRFAHYQDGGINVSIRKHDLREGLPVVAPVVVLSILTLQFTPIEYRLKIVRDIFQKLESGGIFILVEKVIGASSDLDKQMVRQYYGMKAAHGYSAEDIERKRLSLEGVLVPLTAKWNEVMLHDAGFTEIDCFWRWMNFAGWIAVKT